MKKFNTIFYKIFNTRPLFSINLNKVSLNKFQYKQFLSNCFNLNLVDKKRFANILEKKYKNKNFLYASVGNPIVNFACAIALVGFVFYAVIEDNNSLQEVSNIVFTNTNVSSKEFPDSMLDMIKKPEGTICNNYPSLWQKAKEFWYNYNTNRPQHISIPDHLPIQFNNVNYLMYKYSYQRAYFSDIINNINNNTEIFFSAEAANELKNHIDFIDVLLNNLQIQAINTI